MQQQPRSYDLPGGIAVNRTQPNCGAVVSGVDLSQPLSEEQAESVRQALYAHGVIFLRDQQAMDFASHLAFAQIFGEPVTDGPDPERPQITPVKAEAGKREGTASAWHNDGSYQPIPPLVSVLRAIDACTFGGDTCFASSVAVYDNLPEELRDRIDGLRFTSSLAARMPKKWKHFGSVDKWDELTKSYPPVTQPMVTAHHETGARGVYANSSWALGIEGMADEEALPLLRQLFTEFTKPEYQTRWQWRDGDVAIWDNRLVHHYGVPDQTTDRYLERITLRGGPMLSIADWEARQRAAA